MMTQPTLLILAAGIGNRYGGFKQIDPIGPSGEIIIDYSIYDALLAGFKKIVFVISRQIEQDFKARFNKKLEDKIEVGYILQELNHLPSDFSLPNNRQKPWGTAHAILVAKQLIHEPFAAINGDDFYNRSGFQIIHNYLTRPTKNDNYCMVGFKLKNTLSDFGSVSRAICQTDSRNFLHDLVEYTRIEKANPSTRHVDKNGQITTFTGDEVVSMNMWGFTPSIFDHLETRFKEFLKTNLHNSQAEFFIPAVVDNLIKNNLNQVKVFANQDEWFGITYPQDKTIARQKINQLIKQGMYPSKLF